MSDDATDILLRQPPPAPQMLYGTVTAASPLRVRLDGDTDALPFAPPALVQGLTAADRVALVRSGTVLLVLGVVGGACPYAVDDLYTTTSTVAPGTRWPGTTWGAYGAGRVLVGIDSTQTEFDVAGETGGSKDAVLLAHDHLVYHNPAASYKASMSTGDAEAALDGPTYGFNQASGSTGVADTGNQNLQPYVVVYIWRRTA